MGHDLITSIHGLEELGGRFIHRNSKFTAASTGLTKPHPSPYGWSSWSCWRTRVSTGGPPELELLKPRTTTNQSNSRGLNLASETRLKSSIYQLVNQLVNGCGYEDCSSFACNGTSDVGGGSEEVTVDGDTASDLHSWRTR